MAKSQSQTVKEFIALYGVQVASLLLPLSTLPLLSRVLGPQEFGNLLIVQSIFLILFIIIDYGFTYSGSRYVAENVGSPRALANCVSGVVGAKLLLSILYILISVLIYISFEALQRDKVLFLAGMFYGIVQGWSPAWFFQGISKLSQYAVIDIIFRMTSVVAIFLFINSRSEGWLVLLIQAIGSTVGLTYGMYKIYRHVEFVPLSKSQILYTLKMGWRIFLFRVMASALSTFNPIVLGYMTSPVAVAYYTSADRLAAGVRTINIPFNQIFLTKISTSLTRDYAFAQGQFRKSFKTMMFLNIILSLTAFIISPIAVPIILGDEFFQSIKMFQIIVLFSPLFVLGNVLGMQWMIPNKMDSQYNRVILSAAIFNLMLILYLVPNYGPYGVIFASLVSEALICAVILIYLTIIKANPFINNQPNVVDRTKQL